MAKKNISVYLSFLLRHRPETIHLAMDKHGWVLVEDLIEGVNKGGRYQLDLGKLEAIVARTARDATGSMQTIPRSKRVRVIPSRGWSQSWSI